MLKGVSMRLTRFLKSLQEKVAIRRGTGMGYSVSYANNAVSTFDVVIDLNTSNENFEQRFQSGSTKYYVLFQPKLNYFTLENNSTQEILRLDDQLVRISKIDQDTNNLLDDIKNTTAGVLTVTHIIDTPDLQIVYCTDISQPAYTG